MNNGVIIKHWNMMIEKTKTNKVTALELTVKDWHGDAEGQQRSL